MSSQMYELSIDQLQHLGRQLESIAEVVEQDRGSRTQLSDVVQDEGKRRVLRKLSRSIKSGQPMQMDERDVRNLVSAISSIRHNVMGQAASKSMRSRERQFKQQLADFGLPVEGGDGYTGKSYGANR